MPKSTKRPDEKHPDFKCPRCDKGFWSIGPLRVHVRTVHDKRRDHKCPHCDRTFGQADTMRKHIMATHTAPEDRPFGCTQCHKRFGTAYDVGRHERHVHSDERPHACEQCERTFKSRDAMARHMRTVHAPPPPSKGPSAEQTRDHACPYCDKRFGTASNMRHHITTQHEEEAAKELALYDAASLEELGKTHFDKVVQRLYHSTMTDAFEGILRRFEAKAAEEAEEAEDAEAGAAAVLVDKGDTEKVPEKICSDECLDESMECTSPVPLVTPPVPLVTPPEPFSTPQEDWLTFKYPEGQEEDGRKAFATVNRMHLTLQTFY
jgi:DNA-directed RNA polymerase subunit RPC12/RpoP